MPPTMPLKSVFVPFLNRERKFRHRDDMARRATARMFQHPEFASPPTFLPVDSTNNATVLAPLDGNDTLGDCGEAMVCHVDNILTFRQGKGTESVFALSALENQYLAVSGGDNGLDEDEVVNQIWKVGIAGNKQAVCVDSLDIDVTNVALAHFAIDNFYTIQMAWSVPDLFLREFKTGASFLSAMTPDPNNGHYTPLADIDVNGNYRLWTWGGWCWVSQSFIDSVQPKCFIAFSPRQFDPKTGLDSKGRHITTQAALWQGCGGNAIPASVINQFPPIVAPAPAPAPVPTPGPSGGATATGVMEFTSFTNGAPVTIEVDFLNRVIATDTGDWGQIKAASANNKPKDAATTIVAVPATEDDLLANKSVYDNAVVILGSLGITDPTVIQPIEALGTSCLVQGAAALTAYAAANGLDYAPVVVRDGVNYEVDTAANPPILVTSNVVQAASVPIPAPAPAPVAS